SGWIAGNVAGKVGREYACIEIVAAAGREADIEADGLAAIEVGNGLRLGRGVHNQRRESYRDAHHRRPSAWHRDRLRLSWCPYTMVPPPPKCGSFGTGCG